MTRLHRTETRWSKSFPTVMFTPLSVFKCSYDRGLKPCNKVFNRQCDLRRHQTNHSRPSKCKQCNKGFPSPKDLERHDNSVHNNTIKYFCPHNWCRDSIKPTLDDWFVWGFRRKDHWQKHMKDEHQSTRDAIQDIQKSGIPMATLKDEKWVAMLPTNSDMVTFELPGTGVAGMEAAHRR